MNRICDHKTKYIYPKLGCLKCICSTLQEERNNLTLENTRLTIDLKIAQDGVTDLEKQLAEVNFKFELLEAFVRSLDQTFNNFCKKDFQLIENFIEAQEGILHG